jgi:hypothetical protein
MTSYRLLFLAPDGHVDGAREVYRPTDEEAVQAALRLASGRLSELWHHHRRVKRIDPRGIG